MPQAATATQDQEFTNIRPLSSAKPTSSSSGFTNIRPISSASVSRPSEAEQAAALAGPTMAQSRAVTARVPIAGRNALGQPKAPAPGESSGAYQPTMEEEQAQDPRFAIPPPPAPQALATTPGARALQETGNVLRGTFAPVSEGPIPSPPSILKTAPDLLQAAKERGQEFKQHPGAAAAATGVDVAAAVAPLLVHAGAGALEDRVFEPRRQAAGRELTAKGLGIPAPPEAAELSGKSAPKSINAANDLDIASKDLAQIERQTPVNAKGSAGTFQRAKNMLDYADKLWEDGHSAPISRNVNLPINEKNLVASAMKELTPEAIDADPSGGARAKRWVQNSIDKPRSLGSADQFLREINADLESATPERYGPLFTRVKAAVQRGLRGEIETTLTNAGESGVRDVNQRYGAIRNLADRAIQSGLAEAKTEGRASRMPDWLNIYTFVHPGNASVGLSVHPRAFLEPKSSAQLGKGMTKLANTKLQPPPTPTAPSTAWMSATGGPPTTEFTGRAEGPSNLGTRGRGGARTAGLLPAPPSSGAPPNAAGNVESTLPSDVTRLGTAGTQAKRVGGPGVVTRYGQGVRGLLPAPPPETAPTPQPQVGLPPPPGFPPRTPNPMWEGMQPKAGFEAPTHLASPARPPTNIKGQTIRFEGESQMEMDRRRGNAGPAKSLDQIVADMRAADAAKAENRVITRPAAGFVGQQFKSLGLTDLVTFRQSETLETMMRGPRWKSMDKGERIAAVRSVLTGGK